MHCNEPRLSPHGSAKPTRENPAWLNSHADEAFLLGFIDNLWRERELAKECEHTSKYVAQFDNERLRAALELSRSLPITTPELIRLRNAGKITFDRQVHAIIDCLLRQRECLTHETGVKHDMSRLRADLASEESIRAEFENDAMRLRNLLHALVFSCQREAGIPWPALDSAAAYLQDSSK